jgi:hypothetical protein
MYLSVWRFYLLYQFEYIFVVYFLYGVAVKPRPLGAGFRVERAGELPACHRRLSNQMSPFEMRAQHIRGVIV